MKFDNLDDLTSDLQAEINLTPLIDIMLVLLILFMVTSSISLESGLDIDLPKTQSETNKQPSDAVIVSLDSDGAVFVQGKKVEGELKDEITAALKDAETSLVVFEGDSRATLGRTIEIMDIARSAGAQKFAVATDQN